MKWVLIYFVLNATNPEEQALLGHKLMPSREVCEAVALQSLQETKLTSNLRAGMFCVSVEDLLTD